MTAPHVLIASPTAHPMSRRPRWWRSGRRNESGLTFRLVSAREAIFASERTRVVGELEALAREEQERIADELHDGIAHDITLVLFHARALPRQPDESARQVSLSTIEDSAQRALQSIQSLPALMRAPSRDRLEPCPARYEQSMTQAATPLGELLRDAGIVTRASVLLELS